MTVVLRLTDGTQVRLDRRLITYKVAAEINEARGGTTLLAYENDGTPSGTVYVDPNHVVLIWNDR
jgi:hypothetical protein